VVDDAMKPVICLMGPTASGKTPLAIEIAQHFPCEIISVDSAMVYREMDIGTAKPTPDVLRIVPHRLINILDPAQAYSAGQFCTDALREIEEVICKGKIPLLVGGTMLYFRVLQQGLAPLPVANQTIRLTLATRAKQEGWEALYAYLETVDPHAAACIHPSDKQRIQRALEVYELTGQPLTLLQKETNSLSHYTMHYVAISPRDRSVLHTRIAERFQHMLALGLIDEVKQLYARGDLSIELPSMRSVGYRQVRSYLAGDYSYETMHEKAVAATRQVAKRQLTWLRSWPQLTWFTYDSVDEKKGIVEFIKKVITP